MTLNRLAQKLPLPADRQESMRTELVCHVTSLIGAATSLSTTIPGITLHRHVAPTAPVAGTYEPSIALVIQGMKRVNLGGMDFVYGASHFLLTSLDLPVISQVVEASAQRPYLCLRLTLDMTIVRELLRSGLDVPAWRQTTTPAMTTSETTAELLDAFNRLMALHDSPHDISFMSRLIHQEIIYRILQTPGGARLRAIATVGDCSQRMAKAVEWIRENYAKPLRIEELAQVACMGVSTLHHHFRALTSMSPLQYQKRLRLHEARRQMLMDGLDAGSAAFGVGYESASQFNREYSRLFGQSPLRDVRALRLADNSERQSQ
jgi:AraC-like DNA-binding protein